MLKFVYDIGPWRRTEKMLESELTCFQRIFGFECGQLRQHARDDVKHAGGQTEKKQTHTIDWAVVVTQLAERSPPMPEDPGSILVIGNF